MKIDVIEYAQNRSRPENSVHYGKKRRFEKAKEQLAKSPVDKALIIKWVNEYLNAYGIESSCDNNEIDVKTISIDDFNRNIKNTYGLQDEKDIIWIKFTNSGHVGVVAASNEF